jgi:hypothetical protein
MNDHLHYYCHRHLLIPLATTNNTYLLTYLLTPWSRVLLEKLTLPPLFLTVINPCHFETHTRRSTTRDFVSSCDFEQIYQLYISYKIMTHSLIWIFCLHFLVSHAFQDISLHFLVGNQLDAQFILWYVYLNPLHVSSNYVLILRRATVLIQLLV